MKRSLDPVKDLIKDTRSEFDRERLFGSFNWIPDGQSCCISSNLTRILVALNIGGISIQLDDLPNQLVVADLHQLVHLGTSHSLGHNHCIDYSVTWAGHLEDLAVGTLLLAQLLYVGLLLHHKYLIMDIPFNKIHIRIGKERELEAGLSGLLGSAGFLI